MLPWIDLGLRALDYSLASSQAMFQWMAGAGSQAAASAPVIRTLPSAPAAPRAPQRARSKAVPARTRAPARAARR